MQIKVTVWRQKGPSDQGRFAEYDVKDLSKQMSFLEMLDVLNEQLIEKGEEPIAFDHDCREGICGTCGAVVNGVAHGPQARTTLCQLHLREFSDGASISIEPFRAGAFPVIRDLVVDRSAFDAIIQAGGYVSMRTGSGAEANAVPISKAIADRAFDSAACIGCGACVAACPNASAMLFTSAKVAHLGMLPQGQPERYDRVLNMVETMDEVGFGSCTNHGECAEVCPKGISLENIAWMNRDLLKASFKNRS